MEQSLKHYKKTKFLIAIGKITTTTFGLLFFLNAVSNKIPMLMTVICLIFAIVSFAAQIFLENHLLALKDGLFTLLEINDYVKLKRKLLHTYTLDDIKELITNGQTIDMSTGKEESITVYNLNKGANPEQLLKDYPDLLEVKSYEVTVKVIKDDVIYRDIINEITTPKMFYHHEIVLPSEENYGQED